MYFITCYITCVVAFGSVSCDDCVFCIQLGLFSTDSFSLCTASSHFAFIFGISFLFLFFLSFSAARCRPARLWPLPVPSDFLSSSSSSSSSSSAAAAASSSMRRLHLRRLQQTVVDQGEAHYDPDARAPPSYALVLMPNR